MTKIKMPTKKTLLLCPALHNSQTDLAGEHSPWSALSFGTSCWLLHQHFVLLQTSTEDAPVSMSGCLVADDLTPEELFYLFIIIFFGGGGLQQLLTLTLSRYTWLFRSKVYKILASVGIDKPRYTVVSRDISGEGFLYVMILFLHSLIWK